MLFIVIGPINVLSQCIPQAPILPTTLSRLGRTVTYSNVAINGGGNKINVMPGATINLSLDYSVSPTITACPGCVTYFYIGLAGTCVPGSSSSTSYPNTHCLGSVFGGQSNSTFATFTAPSAAGYYYITPNATWTYWCHQYGVSHNNCYNNAIALVVVGDPATIPPLKVVEDSLFNVSGCGAADGGIYITATGGSGSLSSNCIGGCYSYTWSDGSTSQDLENIPAGNYSVTVTDGTCDTILNFTLTEPGFGFSLPGSFDTTLCMGDSLLLNLGGGYDSIHWSTGLTDSIIRIGTSGIYAVEVFNQSCSDRDSIQVFFDIPPAINLLDDTLCMGDTLKIDFGSAYDSIRWLNGWTDPLFNIHQPGLYVVKVSKGACSVKDSLIVSFNVPPVINLPDKTLCTGDSLYIDLGSGYDSIQWENGSYDTIKVITMSGIYSVEVFRGVCAVKDSFYAGFDLPPVLNLMDYTLCEGDSILLDANNPGALHIWQDGSTKSDLLVTNPGTYSVEVINGACTGNDTAVVTYDLQPKVNLGQDTVLCEDEMLLLNADNPGALHIWQDGSNGLTYLADTTDVYSVHVINGACDALDSIYVQFDSRPLIDILIDRTLCEGDELLVNAFYPGASYEWQNGQNTPDLLITQAGNYWVDIKTGACLTRDSCTIDYINFPAVGLQDQLLCNGDSTKLDASHVTGDYLWSNGSMDSIIYVMEAGIYSVSINDNNCQTSDTVIITSDTSPMVDLGNDTTACKDDGCILLNAGFPKATYLWQDGSTDSIFKITETGSYSVTVNTECGMAQDNIIADLDNCTCNFLMPQGFSPNNDGNNDIFRPVTDCDISSFRLKVFNRWGQLVFETWDINSGWNGFYKEEQQPIATYVWAVEYLADSKSQKKHGTITLVR